MERITEKMLERKVEYLNKLTNSPLKAYTADNNKVFTANIGNYHLDYAYGGVALERTVNKGGGVTSIFGCGHVPKRDLFNRLCAYIEGIHSQTHDKGQYKCKTLKNYC